eukprot:1406733-Alexandrium_andersonii.AAC.1
MPLLLRLLPGERVREILRQELRHGRLRLFIEFEQVDLRERTTCARNAQPSNKHARGNDPTTSTDD